MDQDPKRHVCFALDVSTPEDAIRLATTVGPEVDVLKVGLELIMAWSLREAVAMVLSKLGNVFADVKLHDIPNTVGAASAVIGALGVKMFNVHCEGGAKMMIAAKVESRKAAEKAGLPAPLVLGVTLLTSLSYDDLVARGHFAPLDMEDKVAEAELKQLHEREYVRKLAVLAKECGLDGIVCSPFEIETVREACGPDFLIVAPGIRSKTDAKGDQKRTKTVAEAAALGADIVVIGRPIKDAEDPAAAARGFVGEYAEAKALAA